jgi:hypothetical protein
VTLKSKTLKLAPLLAQFLYSHKRLDLQGIGSFFLDPSVVIESDQSRQPRQLHPDGISFENNPSIRESPELIGFISAQTGKMKALASADLHSHLELAQQFLNIGKPFLLEGIGNLVKVRTGLYEFKPGQLLTEKLREPADKDLSHPGGSDHTYEPFLEKEKARTTWTKPVLALLVLVGVGLAVLGGYIVYKRNAPPRNPVSEIPRKETPSLTAANTSITNKPDSTLQTATMDVQDGNYKYILETAGRTRAFKRYNMLKEYRWKVQMETKDSIQFKIFMILPTLALDTTRVVDSLTALNGRKVYVEN